MHSNQKTFTTPYNDVIFKAIFGKEGDKGPLMSLLSSIMDLPIESFEDLILLNTELLPDSIEQKVSRLDLLIKLKDQSEIDVEVQVVDHIAYKERVLYYWSKMYGKAIEKGKQFNALKKCVVINIIYFVLFDSQRMHTKFQILETIDHNKFTDHLEIHVLELSKLNAYNRDIESNLLIDWAEFLSLNSEEKLMDFKDRTDLPEGILKAIEEFERIKDDPNLQMEAVSKQIAILDYMQVIEDATNKGKEEGKIEGKIEGLEEGDLRSKYEIVKNLKALGSSLEFIAQATGLDLEIIEKL